MNLSETYLIELLRSAVNSNPCSITPKEEEWVSIFLLARKQTIVGVVWPAVKDFPLPTDIAMQWMGSVEIIRGLNKQMNTESARMTRLFEEIGRKSIILKGQANARLYPDKFLRQAGDIDIWVEGDRESVLEMLVSIGMIEDRPTVANVGKKDKATSNSYHVQLPPTNDDVTIEVHFRPSSGNHNPITNRKLQLWLEKEIQSISKVEEGFYVPSIKFALVMQLSHIQRHLLKTGIGLRQICDYYWLLQKSTERERVEVSNVLRHFGMCRTAGALMWVLREVLCINPELLLCKPDEWRGEMMLNYIMEDGNFGHYSHANEGKWQRFLGSKQRHLKLLCFDFWEVLWAEIDYWKAYFKTLMERFRRRSFSLR